jgi:hypothetical protein
MKEWVFQRFVLRKRYFLHKIIKSCQVIIGNLIASNLIASNLIVSNLLENRTKAHEVGKQHWIGTLCALLDLCKDL